MVFMIRPRRLRRNPAIRKLVRETRFSSRQLILPVFVNENITEPREISAMPGVYQHSLASLAKLCEQVTQAQIGGIMLFGIPATKDTNGSAAWAENGILNRAIAVAKATVTEDSVIFADTCLDEFTEHGHCGVLTETKSVDNDKTVALYQKMALSQAAAGVDFVSPSGMMDGQVAAIRQALDQAGFTETGILAYSAKYASAFFGPFREAVESSLVGDRCSYQQDPGNRLEGSLEAALDEAEAADILMVKPAGYYLDVLADVTANTQLPVFAYQVSGEYAMIKAAGEKGWIDSDAVLSESVLSIFRAGARGVLTYGALELAAQLMQEGK